MNSSGVLTAVPDSPFATGGTAAGSFGCCVVVDPTGEFVYVAEIAKVYAFGINASSGDADLAAPCRYPQETDLPWPLRERFFIGSYTIPRSASSPL
jgi:hypothetical protein